VPAAAGIRLGQVFCIHLA